MTARPALVLLPGLVCDGALWAYQAQHVADLAAVHIADLTRHESIAAMAETVLDEAPPAFALAGLSMGGYVALEVVRRAPERVTRLALFDTTARADTREKARQRRFLLRLAQRGRFKGVTPRLLPQLIHPDRLGDAALAAAVLAMAERVGQAAFIRQETALLARADGRHNLAAIACPTLVVCGRQDALTPLELSEELARLIPRARLAVIEDCGHLPTMERPEEATALLREWLTARWVE